MANVKVAAAQMDLVWHDRRANYASARRLAEEARQQGAEIFVLPEMFATGFSLEASVTAEPLEGPTPTFLRTLARDLDMAVVGGFVLGKPGGRPRNVSLAVDRDGRDLALYAKMHLIALLGESARYEPGERPVPFDLGAIRAASFICYDLRFPELFRAVVNECGLILVIASWPAPRQLHWDVLLQARAVECQSFIMGVNRVGEGGGYTFSGGSAVIDPLGQVIARADAQEALLVADLDQAQIAQVRENFPFLRDRRPDLFHEAATCAANSRKMFS
jgi:predicted amidohydrolase